MQNQTALESNNLWFSGLLPILYPEFYTRLSSILKRYRIEYNLLPNTKDIWARDYMPVQIGRNDFVQFVYDPDYLKSKKYRHLKSNPDDVCAGLNIVRTKSKLVVDGGNVIRSTDKIIMCDKVFNENPNVNPNDLIEELEEYFKTDKIYFIPWDKHDFTGHADGMVRFIDNDNVLINEQTNENQEQQRNLRIAISNAGLNTIELPFKPTNENTNESAIGLYLNYLEMERTLIVPVFGKKEDDDAIKILESVFKGKTVVPIDCNEIAIKGGVLNCISWNISIKEYSLREKLVMTGQFAHCDLYNIIQS